MEILAIVLLFCFLMLIGIPIAFAMGMASLLYLANHGVSLQLIAHTTINSCDSFPTLAIPLFILAGSVMNECGVTRRIFRSATAMVGSWRGGLGHVNVLGSMFFSGMSGAALADLGGLGLIEIEGMKKEGYDYDFTVAITGASSIVGPIIPPSIPFVIYGIVAKVSIGELFIAGFLPGILIGLGEMIGVYFYARRYPDKFPTPTKMSLKERAKVIFDATLALLTPGIILGGILLGICSPTEAAAVAVVYAMFLGFFIYRELKIPGLIIALKDTMINTAAVMFIIAMSSLMGWVITASGANIMVSDYLLTFIHSPWLVLLVVNIILLIAGTLMDSTPNQLLFIPILLPIMQKIGVDPVHFGVWMTVNLMIGLFTPPVGVCLYMLKQVSGLSFERVTRITLPWMIPSVIVLILMTYLPSSIVLFLPRLVFHAIK